MSAVGTAVYFTCFMFLFLPLGCTICFSYISVIVLHAFFFKQETLKQKKRDISNADQRHSTLYRLTLAAAAATPREKTAALLCDGHRSRMTSAASQQQDRRGNAKRLQSSLSSVRSKPGRRTERACRAVIAAVAAGLLLSPPMPSPSRWVFISTPPLFYTSIDLVGVGWQRHCRTCCSLRELDNQGIVFFFFLAVAHSWSSS